MGMVLGTFQAALQRPYLRHLLTGFSLASVLSGTALIIRFDLDVSYRGWLGAMNEYANERSEKVSPRDLCKVVEEEKRLLGITAPVLVHLCGQYAECRKEETSYSTAYPDGSYAVYLQPRHLSRGIIAHELTHVAKDFTHLQGASPEYRDRHYLLIGEPRAALAGIRKTF